MTADELALSLHPVVLATPGVAGLVPTMTTALGRLQLHRGRPSTRSKQANARNSRPHEAPTTATTDGDAAGDAEPVTSGEGIDVTVKDETVTVVIDITVSSTTSVLVTALAVRSAAARVVKAAHPGQFTVNVNVLDRDQSAADTTTPTPSQVRPRSKPPRAGGSR